MGTFDYWDNDPKIHHPSEPDYKLNTLTYGSLKENEFIILFGGPIAGRPAVYQPSNGVISDGWIYVRSKV